MLVALAQLNLTVGAVEDNARKIIDTYHESIKNNADLVIFSEIALCGYPPKDLLLHKSFLQKENDILNKKIIPLTSGNNPPIIMGANIEEGNKLFNSALIIENGEIKSIHKKTLLPNYDVFDESRYYHPSSEHSTVSVNNTKLVLTVCEDIWNNKCLFRPPLYDIDPLEHLFSEKPDLLINLSASPYHKGKIEMRNKLLSYLSEKNSCGIFYLNQVGGNDDLIFDGNSMVYNRYGQLVHKSKSFEEELFFFDSEDLNSPAANAIVLPEENIGMVASALILGLKDYIAKVGFSKVVIGLSGGLDSAVVAAIAVKALGQDNVFGVMMPSVYSSEHSLNDALELTENLGIAHKIISIDQPFRSYLSLLNEGNDALMDLAEENIQSRIRGNILMHIANREGYLVLATGNRSELAVGYCTLYGDMAGALAPIADLSKTEVYELAHYLNKNEPINIIPENTISKPPSAELRPNQKDEDSLPPYSILDPILDLYIKEQMGTNEIIKKGYDPNTVDRVIKMVNRAEFKREQSAPALRISTFAFGSGRRMPIAGSNKWSW